MDKIFVATRLDTPTHSALKSLAEKKDRTVAYLLRKAVEGYVQAEAKKDDRGKQAA